MVPPWVPPLPPDPPDEFDDVQGPDAPPGAEPPEGPMRPEPEAPIAPARRFYGARRSLGAFMQKGNLAALKRGLGSYVRSGYGGSRTATRRLGGTAQAAVALHRALGSDGPLDAALYAGRDAGEIIDAVIEIVRPIDGTQDAESGRSAVREALSELLVRFPDADLLSLTDEQRAFAIERFVALDVYGRIYLDLGKALIEKAPSVATALSRLRQIKDYVKETVAVSFRKLRAAGRQPSSRSLGSIVKSAIRTTFDVFEGYAE